MPDREIPETRQGVSQNDSSARPQTVLLENAIKFPQRTGFFVSIVSLFVKLFDMKIMQILEKKSERLICFFSDLWHLLKSCKNHSAMVSGYFFCEV